MNIYGHISYRTLLKAAVAERVQKNPSYSLRAMARHLALAPSTLSDVIRGKRNFGIDTAFRVAKKLGLDEKGTEYFCLLVENESSKDFDRKKIVLDRLSSLNKQIEFTDLSVDQFAVISDWYHFAILKLMEVSGFQSDSGWVAKRLGISKLEAELAVDRLLRIGLIGQTSEGKYFRKNGNPKVQSVKPNEGLRRYHRQTLAKALESIDTQTPQEKFVGSENIALNQSQLPEYEKIIEECFAKILALSKRSKNSDQVYHLGIQLFRLTQNGDRL